MKTSIRKSAITIVLSAVLVAGSVAHAQSVSTTTTASTTSAGMISEVGPDAFLIRSETDPTPVRYGFSASTVYVDETGAPVSREIIRSGVPVTISYTREGDRFIADRVIVRRTTTTTTEAVPVPAPAPTVIEKTTTVRPPPVIIEKPVIVEKRVPVIVEKRVPVPVEKPVIIEQKPAPAPLIEEKKTTTTTTTTNKKKNDDD